jgi:chromosome segregation ATPase
MLNNNENIKTDVNNSLAEIKQLLLNNVSKNEFERKNNEIQEQINFTKNSLNIESKSGTEISNKLDYEIKNINQKIQELKLANENMKNKLDNFNDTFNNEINIIKQNNNKILNNEIKINELNNKNNSYQKKLDEYYQDLNNFKNEIKLFISSNN